MSDIVGADIDSAENIRTLDTIRSCASEIDATEQSMKTTREMLKEIEEGLPEYEELKELKAEVQNAQMKLKEVLMRNARYNDLSEKLGRLGEKVKEEKEVLSNALLLHYKQTSERQVEISDNTAREVILSGKLGKEQKYQTSMFVGDE